MNRKAFMKTIEVGIAIVLTYLFLILITPKQVPTASRERIAETLSILQQNDDFRNCVISENGTCVDSNIRLFLQASFDYVYSVSSDPNYVPSGLPQKRIFVDSIFISGNTTLYKPKIFKVYYWTR